MNNVNHSMHDASDMLCNMIEVARRTHDRNLIRRVRRLWQYDTFGSGSKYGEKWTSILKKFDSDDNVWLVWWWDGVSKFIERGCW